MGPVGGVGVGWGGACGVNGQGLAPDRGTHTCSVCPGFRCVRTPFEN